MATPRVYHDVVIKIIDGTYEIWLEDSYLPPISVNKAYQEMVRNRKSPKEERDFIRRKLDAGRRLIGAIEQRRGTIRRITDQILDRQKDLFEHGIEHLKPLKMQEVADSVAPLSDEELPPLPAKGSLDLEQTRAALYFIA